MTMSSKGKMEDPGDISPSSLPDKCQSLRLKSIRKRMETERNKNLPKQRKPRERPAPLSKYRRKTANARERQRMHEVNVAFEKLKESIPHHKLNQIDEKKDTKITTLRCAITYINSLSELLQDLSTGKSVSPEYYFTDAQLGINPESPGKGSKGKKGKGKKRQAKGKKNQSKAKKGTPAKRIASGRVNKPLSVISPKVKNCLVIPPGVLTPKPQMANVKLPPLIQLPQVPLAPSQFLNTSIHGLLTTSCANPAMPSNLFAKVGGWLGQVPGSPGSLSPVFPSQPSPGGTLSPMSSFSSPSPRMASSPNLYAIPSDIESIIKGNPASNLDWKDTVIEEISNLTPLTGVDCFVSSVNLCPNDCGPVNLQDLLGTLDANVSYQHGGFHA